MKKWLIEGFCEKIGYQCLMPVEYRPIEEDGTILYYEKQRMVCKDALRGECEQEQECLFYSVAPERMEKSSNWYEG